MITYLLHLDFNHFAMGLKLQVGLSLINFKNLSTSSLDKFN